MMAGTIVFCWLNYPAKILRRSTITIIPVVLVMRHILSNIADRVFVQLNAIQFVDRKHIKIFVKIIRHIDELTSQEPSNLNLKLFKVIYNFRRLRFTCRGPFVPRTPSSKNRRCLDMMSKVYILRAISNDKKTQIILIDI
ncbi:hypothetical protein V520_10910 [Pseudomonas putida KG-4]|nr:hypothetical protein V520_10910 [Pseudomonas putida KG-4]